MRAFYTNIGLYGAFIILCTRWFKNGKIDGALQMATTTLIYYIFQDLNAKALNGMFHLNSFWAIMEGYSEILNMKAHE